MGSDFNKRTGNNVYPDVNDTSNNSGYRRRSGFMENPQQVDYELVHSLFETFL